MNNSSSVVIIDYGSGNLRSVAKAFERTNAKVTISSDVSLLESASHIVLPGVGAFGDCMAGLSAIPDMLSVLNEQVRARGKWFLGICVGMQMLFDNGYENGIHKGLSWISGEVVPIKSMGLKIPQMGWNELKIMQDSPILKSVTSGDHAYFVHSYHAKLVDNLQLLAVTEYGENITAIVAKDNIFGTQFHPEKSQRTGLKIIENFVSL